jgi:hypothetical protein
LVEQVTLNHRVEGSSPSGRTFSKSPQVPQDLDSYQNFFRIDFAG